MIESMLPQVMESGMPFFAPFSGALSARLGHLRNVFNIRASYAGTRPSSWCSTSRPPAIRLIAIAYQNNSFGKEVFDATQRSMAKHKLEATAIVTVENNLSHAAGAAVKIAGSSPEAVLGRLPGKPTIDFVESHTRAVQGAVALRSVHHGARPPRSRPRAKTPPASRFAGGAAAAGQHGGAHGARIPAGLRPPAWRWSLLLRWRATSCLRVRRSAATAGKNPTRAAFIDRTWNLKALRPGRLRGQLQRFGPQPSRFVDADHGFGDGPPSDKPGGPRAHPCRTYPEIVSA